MDSAFTRLREVAGLPHDWDSYGAVPPSSDAIAAARHVLQCVAARSSLESRRVEPLIVGDRADGGVLMEWRGPGGAVEIHVEPDGSLGYLRESEGTAGLEQEYADRVSLSEIDRQLTRIGIVNERP